MDLPQRLKDGYLAFRNGRLAAEQHRYRDLAERGQSPQALVIGCCDSRVSPEVIFDAGPGEIFVIRNVANLVPPYAPDMAHHGVSSAIEYAVAVLEVSHIVVLGHAQCGGIRAFAEKSPAGDFIGRWLSLLRPVAASLLSRGETPGNLTRFEQESILASIENLKTFPFVHSRCESGKLSLCGAYFDVATGELWAFDPESARFVAITPLSASPG